MKIWNLLSVALVWLCVLSFFNDGFTQEPMVKLPHGKAKISKDSIIEFKGMDAREIVDEIRKRKIEVIILDRFVPKNAKENIGKEVKNAVAPDIVDFYSRDPHKITYFSNPKSRTVSHFMLPYEGNHLGKAPPLVEKSRLL